MPQLIDRWMPEFGAREIHRIRVDASVSAIYSALYTTDFARSAVVRALLVARALPAIFTTGGLSELGARVSRPMTLTTFEEGGFRILAAREPQEVVIGLEGSFWTPSGGVRQRTPEDFLDPVPAGIARVIWNFRVDPVDTRASLLSTETRVGWSDPGVGRSFLLYWRLIRPWSGITRRFMLRSIRVAAEDAHLDEEE